MRKYITVKIGKIFKIDAHYFISGGFWLTMSQVVTITFGITVSSLFAHLLDETEYGTYRYIIGISLLLSSFSLTGLNQSVFQAAAKKYYQFYLESVHTNLIYSIGITITSLIGALYYVSNENIILAFGCIIIAIFQPILNTYQNIFSFLEGSKRFRESTILQTIKALIVSIIAITSVMLTQNILLLIITYFITNSLFNYFAHLLFKPKQMEFTPKHITYKYLEYAKHTSVQNILVNIAFRLDTIIVFQQLGAAELAIYTIANIIPEQIKGSVKNITSLLLPRYVEQNDLSNIKANMYVRSFQLLLILLAITLVYIFLAPFIYHFLFPGYGNAVFYSQIIILAIPAFVLYLPYSALLSRLEQKKLYGLTIFTSLLQIILLILLTSLYGILGAIASKIIHRYFFAILSYYYLHKLET